MTGSILKREYMTSLLNRFKVIAQLISQQTGRKPGIMEMRTIIEHIRKRDLIVFTAAYMQHPYDDHQTPGSGD